MPEAFAVRDSRGDAVMLKTVFAHERGAMVNWLGITCGVNIPSSMAAEEIKEIFLRLSAKLKAELVRVQIDVVEVVDAAKVEVDDQ
jgi:hypothetical protein